MPIAAVLSRVTGLVPALALLSLISLPGRVMAQEPEFFEIPSAEAGWTYGRRLDESQLRYCVDRREPDWEISSAIGTAIASALLLEPVEHIVQNETPLDDITKVYAVMLEHCDVYMGFKLIPDGYQNWVTLTQPYYWAEYVFIGKDPEIKRLGDVPRDRPIGARMGTTAFIRLVSYRLALPAEQRWPLFPLGTNELALEMLAKDGVEAALIWGPSFWAIQRVEPAYGDFRVIDSDPLPETRLGVGALMLANQTFLRTAVDEAVAALIADGTIAGILDGFDFPAETRQ